MKKQILVLVLCMSISFPPQKTFSIEFPYRPVLEICYKENFRTIIIFTMFGLLFAERIWAWRVKKSSVVKPQNVLTKEDIERIAAFVVKNAHEAEIAGLQQSVGNLQKTVHTIDLYLQTALVQRFENLEKSKEESAEQFKDLKKEHEGIIDTNFSKSIFKTELEEFQVQLTSLKETVAELVEEDEKTTSSILAAYNILGEFGKRMNNFEGGLRKLKKLAKTSQRVEKIGQEVEVVKQQISNGKKTIQKRVRELQPRTPQPTIIVTPACGDSDCDDDIEIRSEQQFELKSKVLGTSSLLGLGVQQASSCVFSKMKRKFTKIKKDSDCDGYDSPTEYDNDYIEVPKRILAIGRGAREEAKLRYYYD